MDAKCGHHEDRAADGGTCERCGTFLCAECVVPGASPTLCTSCLALLDRGPHVRHVRILAVLMMIHGGLLAAMGAYYVLFGGFMLDALADIPADPASPEAELLPELLVLTFAGIGLTQLAPGVLHALAGWQLFRFRGRVLGAVAAGAGLAAIFGCYCAPTALALGAYAAWVLSRDDVRARLGVGAGPGARAPRP